MILDSSNNSSKAAACNNKCFLLLSGCCSYSFRALVLNNPKLSEAKPFPIEKIFRHFLRYKGSIKNGTTGDPGIFPSRTGTFLFACFDLISFMRVPLRVSSSMSGGVSKPHFLSLFPPCLCLCRLKKIFTRSFLTLSFSLSILQ